MSIGYHECADGIAFSASATFENYPLIENDEIAAYARLVTVKYAITNTYNYTLIEGLAVRIKGFTLSENPSTHDYLYYSNNNDRKSILPGETAVLRSYHLFVPAGWLQQYGGFTLIHPIGGDFIARIPATESREIKFDVALDSTSYLGDQPVVPGCNGIIRLPEEN